MVKEAKVKLIKMIIAALICFLVFAAIIIVIQTGSQLENQTVRSVSKLEETMDIISERAAQAETAYQEYDDAMKSKVEAIAYLAQNKADYEFTVENLQELCEVEGIAKCWIIDSQGRTIAASDAADETDFTIRRFSTLRDGFDDGVSEPFTIEWASEPMRYCGARIDSDRMFVIAQDPSGFSGIIEQITSVENNISNISIGNSGFVFSISKLTNTIETYRNHELIDADAFEVGLTAESLKGTSINSSI